MPQHMINIMGNQDMQQVMTPMVQDTQDTRTRPAMVKSCPTPGRKKQWLTMVNSEMRNTIREMGRDPLHARMMEALQ